MDLPSLRNPIDESLIHFCHQLYYCIYWLIIGLLGSSGGQLSVNNQSTLAVCSAVKWRTMLEYPGRPAGVWSWCWKYKMSGRGDWCWQSYSAGGVLTISDVQLLSPANIWWISLSESPITHRQSSLLWLWLIVENDIINTKLLPNSKYKVIRKRASTALHCSVVTL